MQVNLFLHKRNSCVSVAASGEDDDAVFSSAFSQVCCCSNFASVGVCVCVGLLSFQLFISCRERASLVNADETTMLSTHIIRG